MNIKINTLFRILCFLACLTFFAKAGADEFPTAFIQNVNIMTGHPSDPENKDQYEYYKVGKNQVAGQSVTLSKGDFRIGKVKTSLSPSDPNKEVSFLYSPHHTEVINNTPVKNIYRFANDLLQAIDQYEAGQLYRSEEFYWQKRNPTPFLISRVLIDQTGQAQKCTVLSYNSAGKLIKETFYGDLSGTCESPLIIQPSGFPKENGIESYSVTFEYSAEDPDLILKQVEDNGMITHYEYHPITKQCIAKLRGNGSELIARAFYIYDDKGFLAQTVMDDGQGESIDDLTAIKSRQIMVVETGHELPLLGKPLLTASKYLDLETGLEKFTEKTIYTYDRKGQLTQQDYYDADENLRYSIHQNYDEKGKLISTVDSRGEVALPQENPTKQRYNEKGLLSATIDPYGNETKYSYDSFGRLTETLFPLIIDENENAVHPIQKQEYDINDQISRIEDGAKHTTRTLYNARKKPISITYPDGSIEKLIYFLDGELKEKIACNGFKTRYDRDNLGRIIKKEELSPSGQLIQALTYTYSGSNIIAVSDGPVTTRVDYDGAGRQVRLTVESPSGNKRTEWIYDECGQKTQTKEWFGRDEIDYVAKIEELDGWQNKVAARIETADGQIQIRQTTADSNPPAELFFTQEQTTCNQLGQTVKLVETVDQLGTRELKTYDALQRLENYVKLNSIGEKISEYNIRYNVSGQKVVENHHVIVDGQVTRIFQIRWSYDSLNRLIAIQEGAGTSLQKITSYQYNLKGQLEAVIKPNGVILQHFYHDNGTLAQFLASDGSFAYEYTYDERLRLIEVSDRLHGIVQSRRYNDFDDIIEENLGLEALILTNEFDLAGRRTKLTLPGNSQILYHYEGAQLISIERKGLHNYEHSYNFNAPSGHLASSHLGGDLGLLSYQYDAKGKLLGIQSPWWSEEMSSEGYDPYGRLCSMTIQDPKDRIDYSYSYGEDRQLIQETGHINKNYRYDSLYNRIAEDDQLWNHNELNQLVQTPQTQFHYDVNGNLIEKGTSAANTTFEYDALNRLIRAETSSQAIHYTYDAFHRQIRQQVYSKTGQLEKTEYLIYDGDKEIGKTDDQGKVIELRILGLGKGAEIGSAIALELNGQVYIPVHDHQGSVRCLLDMQSQSVVEFYRYSTYGVEEIFDSNQQLIEESMVGNPWRFASKRKDPVTGLISYGKRHYDPSMGRWTTPDPLFFYDCPNLYTFVRNDGINNLDLYGLFSISDTWHSAVQFFYYCLESSVGYIYNGFTTSMQLAYDADSFEKVGKLFIGEGIYKFGFTNIESQSGNVGDKEVSDKVRITYVNGILTNRVDMFFNLDLISKTHNGTKVHYVFRATKGWTNDLLHCINIKAGYWLGFRSHYSEQIVQTWREMIDEMGGIDGGGIIIHYAHSLGGTETERAKHLLTPEEQRMIRIITFGSASFISKNGFQDVTNHVSVNDFVHALELLSGRNIWDPQFNVKFHGTFSTLFFRDHPLDGITYRPLIVECGELFLKEFAL